MRTIVLWHAMPDEWCLVETRVPGEPPEAIPLDRCEAHHSGRVWLFVPPDEDVVIRVLGSDGNVLRTASR